MKCNQKITFVSGMLLGALCFLVIYGFRVLNPVYDDWLMSGGDLTQHYLGWRFFRESEWLFPIGLMNTIAWPNEVAVIFTDSIPGMAVICKLLSPILPETFQYFGLWEILCFMLQGGFAAVLLNFSIKDLKKVLLGSVFFILAPVFVYRVFMHTALASEWLILWALYLGVTREQYGLKKRIALWSVLGFLCGMIHLYYVPFCLIVLCGFLLNDLIYKKQFWQALAQGAGYCISVFFSVYLMGGFSHDHQLDAGGLGQFSFNLNGFINPQGWSCILPDLPLYGEGAGEGLAYLGAGILFLVVSAIVLAVIRRKNPIRWFLAWKNNVAIIFIVFVSALASFSHELALNDKVIWNMPYPDFFVSLWGMFRSSGRFIWTVVYLIMIAVIVAVMKLIKKEKIAVTLLSAALLLQVVDIHEPLCERREAFWPKTEAAELSSCVWKELADSGNYQHMIFVSDIIQNQGLLYGLSSYAADYGMTINRFYLSHNAAQGDINRSVKESMENLQKDCIYIFKPEEVAQYEECGLSFIECDGVVVGVLV